MQNAHLMGQETAHANQQAMRRVCPNIHRSHAQVVCCLVAINVNVLRKGLKEGPPLVKNSLAATSADRPEHEYLPRLIL